MTRIIELGHTSISGISGRAPGEGPGLYTSLRAMVLRSVGPIRHEVSVPFHDSQVRGAALLIQTGWDQYWNTGAYWEPGPFLAEHLIFRLARSGVRVVGVDFSISGPTDETRLIRTGQMPVVEN